MGFPRNIGIIDCMIGFPVEDRRAQLKYITDQTKDRESKEEMEFPAQYMFKTPPKFDLSSADPVSVTLHEMDRFGIERGLVGIGSEVAQRAFKEHPDRFIPGGHADPNRGMEAVRQIVREHEEFGIRSVSVFPAGTFPQVAINDKKMYPIYAKCVELGIGAWVNAGVPGPRLRYECQYVGLIDEVMFDFPELTFVTWHGCDPWTDLAVKLMLKWPGLHYATSAWAPKYYPKDVIDFANTRGADKVIYAGYFPMGLTLERIMSDMDHVALRDEVWPKFLRENALRVLGLD